MHWVNWVNEIVFPTQFYYFHCDANIHKGTCICSQNIAYAKYIYNKPLRRISQNQKPYKIYIYEEFIVLMLFVFFFYSQRMLRCVLRLQIVFVTETWAELVFYRQYFITIVRSFFFLSFSTFSIILLYYIIYNYISLAASFETFSSNDRTTMRLLILKKILYICLKHII